MYSHVDVYANGICTKIKMTPYPQVGGHKNETLNEEKFMSRSPKSSELNDPVPFTKICKDDHRCFYNVHMS